MRQGLVAGLMITVAGAASAFACPVAKVHPETARFVQMGAGGQPAAKAYDATISGPQAKCSAENGGTKVHLTFKVDATLAPNVEAKPVKVPYFVAILSGDKIVAKEVFPVSLPFGVGALSVSVNEIVDKISLPLRPSGKPDYELLVGFQLTPEQLRAVQN